MSEPVFFFEGDDEAMQQAYADAQQSFKYFWRELSWERQRIVPGLDMAMVKLPFTDGPRDDDQPEYEHMWVGEVNFDGEFISGELLNSPNWLTSVAEGEAVELPFSHLTDWMMVAEGRVYGAYTVNAMRARMSKRERKEHDEAWGLDFGDPAEVLVEIERGRKPKKGLFSGVFGGRAKNSAGQDSFTEHPMGVAMLEKIEEQLQADPAIAQTSDDMDWTLLQREAQAGNFGIVKLLVKYGADIAAKSPSGFDASELAGRIGWAEIAEFLNDQPNT